MSETFAWPEGHVWLWTGTATASAIPGYAQSVAAELALGWDNYWTVTGEPRDTLTGKRADVMIGTLHTFDNAALRVMFDAQTAVHMHLAHSASVGSAGYFLYSGRLDRVRLMGSDGQISQFAIEYHANIWSGYG